MNSAAGIPLLDAARDLSAPAAAFLARHDCAGADLAPFDADASARRYFRLIGKGRVLMEDRHDPVGFAAYLRLSRHLCGLGLSAPSVIGADPSAGLALIEDFGDGTYAACLAEGQAEADLYSLAVDALLHLHHHPRALDVSQPRSDPDLFLNELDLFSRWFAPAFKPGLDRDRFSGQFRRLWARALTQEADRPVALMLRDFHVENLMLLPGRTGVRRCGLLDFQDAVIGPAEYDLVSLLQDARRDLSPDLEEAMFARYCAGMPRDFGPPDAFRRRYAVLGAQRHARIAGVFVRLCQRDAKPRYLEFLPRVLCQLRAALNRAELTDILLFLDEKLPGWATGGADMTTRLRPLEGACNV